MNKKRITVPEIWARKKSGKKIVALTAYDFSFAQWLDQTPIDIILVGDSLGMVALGYETTLPVTLDEMIAHTRAVRRGITSGLLVGDMPFMSYQISPQEALRNAGRLVQEGGAEAVKLEGGTRMAETVRTIVQAGIPVMGHIGLTPQSVNQFGGYRVQGKTLLDAKKILQDARELEKTGVFSLVLEGIPSDLGAEITREVKVPTIGIGAGPEVDGQILVLNDLLGLTQGFSPKFVKRFRELGTEVRQAVEEYATEVRTGEFPGKQHSYSADKKPWTAGIEKNCG